MFSFSFLLLGFGPPQTHFRFGSPNAVTLQSFEQNQTLSSSGYSFNSFQSVTSSGSYLQSTRCFDQSARPFGQATNPPVQQTNLNPVAKAVMDNFLGILPTKRRKIVNCHVCGLLFNSDSQAEAHFQGAKTPTESQTNLWRFVRCNSVKNKLSSHRGLQLEVTCWLSTTLCCSL